MGCVISLGDIWRYLSKNLIFELSDIWRYLAIVWRYLAVGEFTLGPGNYRPGDIVGCRHLSPGGVVGCCRLSPGGGRAWGVGRASLALLFGIWLFQGCGGTCGLCPKWRDRRVCALPSEVYPSGKLQWHFTCGSDFRHSLWLPFVAGFAVLERLKVI